MSYAPDHNVTWLVQHYSATFIENPYTYSALHADHIARGFREVGYHYYIRLDGTVHRGRDLSQPGRFEIGAHSLGENDESIGICVEGGRTKAVPEGGVDTRTPAQIKAQIALIDELSQRFPNAVVKGHRDMPGAATLCPGYDATAWWESVLRARASGAREPVKELAEDAGKPLHLSKTVWATIASAAGGVWSAWQAADTVDKVIAGAVVVAMILVFSERIRKIKLGKLAKAVLQ